MDKLVEFIQSNPDPRELKRALAVQIVLKGYVYRQIAEILHVSDSFISKWWLVFNAEGVGGLQLGYLGCKSYLDTQQQQAVIDWLQQKNYWHLVELQQHLEDTYSVKFKSCQSYYELFAQAGISWQKTQKCNPKKEPQLVEKKGEILEQLRQWLPEIAAGRMSVFFLDESHLLWGDLCGYVWGKTNLRIEVPIVNERQKQTYFGALDYHTKEFLVQAYSQGNSQNTMAFLNYLQAQRPGQRIAVIWDGASYHRSNELQAYLQSLNAEHDASAWQVTCIRFAPNAPEQNPVEDVSLKAKRFIRELYHLCNSFLTVKLLFELVTHRQTFDFPKLSEYAVLPQLK